MIYFSSESKNLEMLGSFKIFKEFSGEFTHDHETALYHFGTEHGECNVHLERYLLKNTKGTGNVWSNNMSGFLRRGMNHGRKEWKRKERMENLWDALQSRLPVEFNIADITQLMKLMMLMRF